MRRKVLRGLFPLAILLALLVRGVVAQTDEQLRVAGQSGAATTRIQSEAALATSRNSGLGMVPPDFSKLKLAPGFLLSLNVLDDPDYAGAYRIDESGYISVPVLGTVHVADETVSEARAQIQKMLLEDKILKDPQVDLSILEYSAPEVTIIGEVTNPGKYPLLVPRKLLDVLAIAGGTTNAAGNEIVIKRGSADVDPLLVHFSRTTNPKAVDDVLVHPGDIVQIKRAGIVYVLGAVTRPGGYVMQEDGKLTVLEAISLASGTTLPASIGKVYLLRRNADGLQEYTELPFDKMSHGKAGDIQLRATDVLYVPTSKIKSAFINGQGVLAAAASASILATTIY